MYNKSTKTSMKRIFKVVCNGVTYGTYNSIEQARHLRDKMMGYSKRDIVINVTQEDIDPRG
jgi:hypothetical protein